MLSDCKLSIVVPVYNGSPYIKHCMDDLVKQTFQDWEAIFVNDGSTDGSGELLDRTAVRDKRFEAIHQNNGGTARARNAGLVRAKGQYITFLDVDDELDPQIYEKLIHLMDETGADMGVCGYYFKIERITEEGPVTTYLEEKTYPSCLLKGQEAIKEKLVDLWDKDLLHNVWNKLYRMDLIREKGLRYRDGHIYTEDRVFNRQFIENCNSIAVTEECLYYYIRERTGSTSEKFRDDYFTIRHKEYCEFRTHFKNLGMWDETVQEYVCREFTERIAGCIENIFHAEKCLSEKGKRSRIAELIVHPDVREAVKHSKCKSRKMRLLVFPIKIKSVALTYLIYKTVYTVRKQNPALFHKLKSKR